MAAIAHHNDPLGAPVVRRGAPLLDKPPHSRCCCAPSNLGLVETVRAMVVAPHPRDTRALASTQ